MTRFFLASIAVISVLALVPYAVEAQKPTPEKGALPKYNQVYVKIIVPTDSANDGKDRPVVESWIADQLKKRGQSKFTAATAWVALTVKGEESKMVWNGWLDDEPWGAVAAKMTERADGRIKLLLDGFGPCRGKVTVSLTDESGSREIVPVEEAMTRQGPPFVQRSSAHRLNNFLPVRASLRGGHFLKQKVVEIRCSTAHRLIV